MSDSNPLLTQEEKERIKAEAVLREEIRKEIAKATLQEQRFWRRFAVAIWLGLNGTFAIGLLGFIGANYLVPKYQAAVAREERISTQSQNLQEKKLMVYTAFCDNFLTDLFILNNFTKTQMWLKENQNNPQAIGPYNRSYVQVRARMDYYFEKYMNNPKPQAQLEQIKALFVIRQQNGEPKGYLEKEILKRANDLEKLIDDFEDGKWHKGEDGNFSTHSIKTKEQFRSLVSLLGYALTSTSITEKLNQNKKSR